MKTVSVSGDTKSIVKRISLREDWVFVIIMLLESILLVAVTYAMNTFAFGLIAGVLSSLILFSLIFIFVSVMFIGALSYCDRYSTYKKRYLRGENLLNELLVEYNNYSLAYENSRKSMCKALLTASAFDDLQKATEILEIADGKYYTVRYKDVNGDLRCVKLYDVIVMDHGRENGNETLFLSINKDGGYRVGIEYN